MILLTLRDYLRQRGQANLRDLALHFETEPEAMRAMLSHLIRKGQIRLVATNIGQCGGCTQCDPLTLEMYYWENPEAPATHVHEQIIQFSKDPYLAH